MTGTVSDPFGIAADPDFGFLSPALQIDSAQAELRLADPALVEVELQAIRVIRYKPGRRCLLEFDVRQLTSKVPTWIGKVRAKGFDHATWSLMRQLHANGWGQESRDGITVPRPIAAIPKWNLWLQEKVPGKSAIGELRLRPTNRGVVRKVADALSKCHHTSLQLPRRHRLSDELKTIHDRLTDLIHRQPLWTRRVQRVEEACNRLAASIKESPACIIHRDYHPEQMVIHDSKLSVLDWDLCTAGDPNIDAGNFLAHLAEHALRHPAVADALNDAALAFADQFLHNSRQCDPHPLVAYGLLSFVRLLGLTVRYPERWPWAEPMLEICESCLLSSRRPTLAVA